MGSEGCPMWDAFGNNWERNEFLRLMRAQLDFKNKIVKILILTKIITIHKRSCKEGQDVFTPICHSVQRGGWGLPFHNGTADRQPTSEIANPAQKFETPLDMAGGTQSYWNTNLFHKSSP